jgi:hypothetical protein
MLSFIYKFRMSVRAYRARVAVLFRARRRKSFASVARVVRVLSRAVRVAARHSRVVVRPSRVSRAFPHAVPAYRALSAREIKPFAYN